MNKQKNITIVLALVIALAIAIQVTRTDYILRLTNSRNIDIIDSQQVLGTQIDYNLLENITSEEYLIIYDTHGDEFVSMKENLTKSLDYMRKEYDVISVDHVKTIDQKYNTVILVLEDIDKLHDVDALMKYVFEGGNAFFAYRILNTDMFYRVYRKLGITEVNKFVNTVGIRLLDNVLLNGRGFEITEKELINNSSMILNLTDECDVLAESIEGESLLWKNKYGQGQFMYFNGTMLGQKKNRGLMIGALSLLEEDFIYPIMNSKVSFIDDFPAPVPDGYNKRITEAFGRNVKRFFKEIWWADMLKLATKYNVNYTGTVMASYSNEVEDITQDLIELNIKDLIYFGRELITQGGELGISGFNNQPLTTKILTSKSLEHKPWKKIETMIDSIEETKKLCEEVFENYRFKVYVPPSNFLSSEGREAIKKSNSDIEVISSLYDIDGSQVAYEQEFEISADGMMEFPRLTNGYIYNDKNKWMILNGITTHGVFSHVVQSNEMLDSRSMGDWGWTELIEEYEELNKMVFDNYRWLRAMTASEGANEMIKYLSCEPRFEKKDDYIKIYSNNFFDKTYFVLRTEKEIKFVEKGNFEKIDENTFLIESNSSICQVHFGR